MRPKHHEHICEFCGMEYPSDNSICPKCDYGQHEQNSELCLTIDVAHNWQTVDEAYAEASYALEQALAENYESLRLIVGGGRIKEALLQLLEGAQWQQKIKSFSLENKNPGAYLIRIR